MCFHLERETQESTPTIFATQEVELPFEEFQSEWHMLCVHKYTHLCVDLMRQSMRLGCGPRFMVTLCQHWNAQQALKQLGRGSFKFSEHEGPDIDKIKRIACVYPYLLKAPFVVS
jgi:hypothetical protein